MASTTKVTAVSPNTFTCNSSSLKLRDLDDAGPVRFEISRLVDQLPVRTDGEQLRMQQPVQLCDITGEHGGLQRPLLDEHRLLLRLVAHVVDRTGNAGMPRFGLDRAPAFARAGMPAGGRVAA
jgi:hypothetical protein